MYGAWLVSCGNSLHAPVGISTSFSVEVSRATRDRDANHGSLAL